MTGITYDENRRRLRASKWRRITVVSIATTLLVAGAATAAFALKLQSNISTAPLRADSAAAAAQLPTEGQNILLIGSDSRGNGDSGRSDALVLVHLAENDERIDAVQIPRDTVVDLPPCGDTGLGTYSGGRGMINGALNYGPACSVAAVEQLTGVGIDHFVQFDFGGFERTVDALGGVSICLPDALYDAHAGLELEAGAQKVNGTEALGLIRTRHSVGDGSDIARLDHQQFVMSAIVQQATSSETLTRPDRLVSFLDAVSSSMTVDPGLAAITDLTMLATRVMRVPTDSITFFVMPWEVSPYGANRVLPSEEAAKLFERISQDAPVTLATPEPDPGSATSHEDGGESTSSEPTSSTVTDNGVTAVHRSAGAPVCES